jgi:hypothetical protein
MDGRIEEGWEEKEEEEGVKAGEKEAEELSEMGEKTVRFEKLRGEEFLILAAGENFTHSPNPLILKSPHRNQDNV